MRQVFIYGGCSSRDAVEWYPNHNLELHSYIARQSLISAFNPTNPNLWDFSPMTKEWQQRMMRGDAASNLPAHIQEHHQQIDLIIWDLMIERVGVRRIRSGGYMTNNPSNRKHIKNRSSIRARTSFGTDEHKHLWSQALEHFVALLKDTGLQDKIVVNGTPWALHDKHGQKAYFPKTGIEPEWFNTTIEQYWQLIEAHDIPVARIKQEHAIADPDHKWGPAYLHYIPETYQAQLEAITDTI